MEAFIASSDVQRFPWAPSPEPPPSPQSSVGSSDPTRTLDTPAAEAAPAYLNEEMLQKRLQILIEGARERWTYAIFWQSSVDVASGATLLEWGDGYYKGCKEDKGKGKASTAAYVAEQESRNRFFRELNTLISAGGSSPDEYMDDEVPDTEWFFLISMFQSFVNGAGLPGQALYSNSPSWIAGADLLAIAPCDRARQAQELGIQTMVCVPIGSGVLEVGSTDLIFYNNHILSFGETKQNSSSPPPTPPSFCHHQVSDERRRDVVLLLRPFVEVC